MDRRPTIAAAVTVAAFLTGVGAPLRAGALEARVVAVAEHQVDPTQKLAVCEPEIYFCGTVEDSPQREGREVDDTGIVPSPPTPLTAHAVSGHVTGGVIGVVSGGEATASAGAAGVAATAYGLATGAWYRLAWDDEFGDPQHLDLFQAARGSASAGATFLDDVTIQGPTGAVGNFRLILTFDRTFLVGGQGSGSASAQTALVGASSTLAVVGISDCTTCGNPDHTVFVPFQAAAGTSWTLSQQLDASGTAPSSPSAQGSSIDVDAGSTAHAYLAVLTPGFTVVAASGHDYTLPEPGAAASGAASLLAIAGVAQLTRRECPAQYFSRSSRLSTLPLGLRGNASTKSTERGRL
jgi:hypothetical protein